MEKIFVKDYDANYVKIICEYGTACELSNYFKFRTPNFMFQKSYKNKMWDGYIKLFNIRNSTLPKGLTEYIKSFCKDFKYEVEFENDLIENGKIDLNQFNSFIESLKLPFSLRDYQINAIIKCIESKRKIIDSATGSGKSLIIYTIMRHYLRSNSKIILIVPNVNLVHQMYNDFVEYSTSDNTFIVEDNVHKIYEGQPKNFNKNIVISTWQSINTPNLSKEFFKSFDVLMCDEAHQFSGIKSPQNKKTTLKDILEKFISANHRYGFSGSIDVNKNDSKVHKLVLEGIFGKIFTASKTHELQARGELAKIDINCINIKYPLEECKLIKNANYVGEIDHIINHTKRNKFICNLSLSLKGNTLVLFRYVESHGKLIYDLMLEKSKDPSRKIFFIHGKLKNKEDKEIKKNIASIVEKETNAIIIASVGVFSEGINIKNLENLILASPTKSNIKIIQQIGRIARIGRSDKATLYDIVDDFSYKKSINYVLEHFLERVKLYNSEKHRYKISNLKF